MATPESTMKSQVRPDHWRSCPDTPVHSTSPQAKKRITDTRTAVAKLEFTSFTPNLPKMAVRAAKKAERRAQSFQFMLKDERLL